MQSDKQIRLAFLLGSGISIPAGMPTTQDITKRVLSGEGIMRHTNGAYYFGPSLYMGWPDEYVPRVVPFLNRLKVYIDLYYLYQTERFTNYEDLYYVASQIYDSETGNHDNPAVQPFIDKVLPEIVPQLVSTEDNMKPKWQLHELAWEAMNYIADMVWRLLTRSEPTNIDYLCSIRDACWDDHVSRVDLFTLNHDTVLERYLRQNGIEFIDGFVDPEPEVKYWNPKLFEMRDYKIRLFKLHGSVNWFRLREHDGNRTYERIGILEKDMWPTTKGPKGKTQRPVNPRPLILIGTFNKMLRYLSWIYAELHYEFFRSMRDIRRLVVSGYGFGDKGINSRIIDWIISSYDHRITIIHSEPESLKKTARGEIVNWWDEWKTDNKLTIIRKRIEETSWNEIKEPLFSGW